MQRKHIYSDQINKGTKKNNEATKFQINSILSHLSKNYSEVPLKINYFQSAVTYYQGKYWEGIPEGISLRDIHYVALFFKKFRPAHDWAQHGKIQTGKYN